MSWARQRARTRLQSPVPGSGFTHWTRVTAGACPPRAPGRHPRLTNDEEQLLTTASTTLKLKPNRGNGANGGHRCSRAPSGRAPHPPAACGKAPTRWPSAPVLGGDTGEHGGCGVFWGPLNPERPGAQGRAGWTQEETASGAGSAAADTVALGRPTRLYDAGLTSTPDPESHSHPRPFRAPPYASHTEVTCD